jgi:hypothetical protein
MAEEEQAPKPNWPPVPDPTERTTQVLLREIASLKEVVFTRLDGMDRAIALANADLQVVPSATDRAVQNLRDLHEARFDEVTSSIQAAREVIQTRFDGMDRALALLQAITDRFPERIDEKISSLKEIHDGQFSGIQVQFVERDVRADKQAESSQKAVDAALQAAKEAVAQQQESNTTAISKSDTANDKRMDQIMALITNSTSATDGKIDDQKERLRELGDRLTRLEGQNTGTATTQSTQHAGSTLMVSGIAVAVAIMSLLYAVISHFVK